MVPLISISIWTYCNHIEPFKENHEHGDCNSTLNTLDMEMNTEPVALSKVDLHISDPLNQLQLLWSWIIRAENGDWTTHCNTALNYLEMETHCMIYFNLHLCTALNSNNFVFLLCMHSGFITSLNFAVCHPWRTLWNSNQMGTSSCTVFLLRFSLNTLYIRLVFIKTQNLPVGILGMNFVFSSLHTSWSRILCTWC
jgi:hypothetical protein